MISRLRREKAWRPTPAQEETASLLVYPHGGWVRTRGDGATELRTIERGAPCRYIIREDGDEELIELGTASPRFAWSGCLQASGIGLFLGAFGFGVLVEGTPLMFVAVIAAFTGMAIFAAGVDLGTGDGSRRTPAWRILEDNRRSGFLKGSS